MPPVSCNAVRCFALVAALLAPACADRRVSAAGATATDAEAATLAAASAIPDAGAAPEPPSAPTPSPPPPAPPATVERLAVAGDLPAFLVRSASGLPPKVVFVPGICSNARAYLLGFPEAARHAGGVVAIDGDLPCAGVPGFRSFSWDIAKQRARIEAALAAAGHDDATDGVIAIGYSQGAAILEQLVERAPTRYARIVLIAAPSDPVARRFAKSRAVVTMACSRDATWRMKGAASAIGALGVPSTYIEMPGCTHGNLADGEAKFGEAFAWLDDQP